MFHHQESSPTNVTRAYSSGCRGDTCAVLDKPGPSPRESWRGGSVWRGLWAAVLVMALLLILWLALLDGVLEGSCPVIARAPGYVVPQEISEQGDNRSMSHGARS